MNNLCNSHNVNVLNKLAAAHIIEKYDKFTCAQQMTKQSTTFLPLSPLQAGGVLSLPGRAGVRADGLIDGWAASQFCPAIYSETIHSTFMKITWNLYLTKYLCLVTLIYQFDL